MREENHFFLKVITRASFLKKTLIAAGAIIFPFACKNNSSVNAPGETPTENKPSSNSTKVYLVRNGTVDQNINKLFELLGGISKYISPTDVVVLKGNAQWPKQGYTNTECIKSVIDTILSIPGFSGEILICDNIQNSSADSESGFYASPENRNHNWTKHNWTTLADEYQNNGKPVAVVRWQNASVDHAISGPSDGSGWIRDFFSFHGHTTYLSYPIFESPLTAGRMIDMKNGVWEKGSYTGRKVKAIFMPTLNNHGQGSEDYAGITSAIKSFFGATEIHTGEDSTITFRGIKCLHIHSSSYTNNNAFYAGELVARYMKTMYSPVLFITCAIWSGYESRVDGAKETKTVLACENPSTLDYISAKEVISPYASWLNPDKNNNTRKQILGCISGGIGTITDYEVIRHEF